MPPLLDSRLRGNDGRAGFTALASLPLVILALLSPAAEVDQVLEIAPVWAGHPVGFCLLTAPPRQYVAYYDAQRRMTVAQRRLEEDAWTATVLRERIGWDSHNYITMALDNAGYLHLAGNMHVHPLRYFRSTRPCDSTTLERVKTMVGTEEKRCTYPAFFRGPEDALVFTYRDGSSGSGNQIYNVYDVSAQTWSRLLDTPLIDGAGKRNAYLQGPMRGPDGYWHLCWVWRATPDCATNHYPSYARSKDLRHWENGQGAQVELPITFETGGVVDPVPEGGGVINGNVQLGFETQQRAVVTYHKFDAAGKTQLYNARLENGAWKMYQSSDWDYRWEFGGGGTIHFEIHLSPIEVIEGGALAQTWSHDRYGKQRWRLDPETLAPVEQLPLPESTIPAGLGKVESAFPGMHAKSASDIGHAEEAGVRYLLRWETLGKHRDRPREKPWPEPNMLRLYRLRDR